MPGSARPERAAEPSPISIVLRSPLYRGATLALFLAGLGYSASAPQIASFLVRDLGASLSTAGFFYLTSFTAPVAAYLVGARSDRSGRRLGLFRWCSLAGFAGWLGIALSTRVWMAFVFAALLLGFSGATASQLFAAVHDDLEGDPLEARDRVVAIVRMALTAGWVVGPVLGSVLVAWVGFRATLAFTATLTLAQVLPLGTLRSRPASGMLEGAPPGAGARTRATPGLRAMLPLLAFTGLFVLAYAGEPIKFAYLPIYMHEQLHLPPAISGAVIGIQPAVELLLMPVAMLVAARIGRLRLLVVGAAFGVCANLCFALSGTAAGMFAGQILMGAVWAVFATLGIIVAQRLLPQAVAIAAAFILNSVALGSGLGGFAGALGVSVLGLPLVFLVPAGFDVLAGSGLAVLSRSRYRDR